MSLNDDLQAYALQHGIDFVGVTSVAPLFGGPQRRLVDPGWIMPEARSLVVTGVYTYTDELSVEPTPGAPRGKFGPATRLEPPAVAHQEAVIREFLREHGFEVKHEGELPAKAAAVRGGWAQYGKNSIVHAQGAGSWVTLATCLSDAELETAEHPIETSDCNDCDECVRACPTGALDEPYHLDIGKCICAWLWGHPIPRELRHTVGNHIHRCSYCQDACPLNRDLVPRESVPFALDGPTPTPELLPLLLEDDDVLRKSLPQFVMSAGAETIRRNAAIALGNIGDPAAIAPLGQALRDHPPRVRAYAAWALAQIGGAEALAILQKALPREEDDEVSAEIEAALQSQ